jgi:soluble lytic murein transglycosylase-like protein
MKRLLLSACLAGLAMSGVAPEAIAAEADAVSTETAAAKAGSAKPPKAIPHTKTAHAKPGTARTPLTAALAKAREDEAAEAVRTAGHAPEATETTASISPTDTQATGAPGTDAPPADGSAVDNSAADAKATQDSASQDKAPQDKAAEAKPKHMNTGHPQIDALVATHARANDVPEALIHRVIVRESKYQKDLVGRCGCIGLMQIKLGTARGLGYAGDAQGLHDPNTNLTYGVKYLAGAYRAAKGDHDRAVHYFARGYYEVAKRQRLADARPIGKLEHAHAPLDITPKMAVIAPKHVAAQKLPAARQAVANQVAASAADTRAQVPAR